MGEDLYARYPLAKARYDQADDLLGFSVSEVSFRGPEEKLKQTQFTQPALFVHSVILAELLHDRGVHAVAAAGHSLGEFSALAYTGAFSFEEGLRLVKERSRLMQAAGEKQPGTMAAVIGIDAETLMAICIGVREEGIVQPANYNSPQQIVVSGSVEGVRAVMRAAKEQGAKIVKELPVSGAFHSPLMAGAVDQFGETLDETVISMVRIPVYANVTAVPVTNEEEIRNLLHHQLTHSVRWMETIENMRKNGVECFIEVGAGKVLSGLVKRISKDAAVFQCGSAAELEAIS